MKQNLYKIIFLFCGVILLNTTYGNGFFEEEKTYNFAFKVSEKPSVEINNEYGEVNILTWEKDSVKVEATIIASSDKLEDITKLLGRVEVTCRGNSTTVVATTEWTEGFSLLRKGAMDLKNILNSDKKLTINYKVYLPANSRLSINNRFGDVYLPDYSGPLRINLSHGDLRARKLQDGRSISVRYGKAIIKNLESGLLKIEYGNLILDKSDYLTLESKSSTLEVFEVKALAIESKNDELRIDRVESLRGTATYTHTLVKRVDKMVKLTTNYGDLLLKEISKDFELISMTGSGTDYDLEFKEGASFQFEVNTTKEKGVMFSPKPDKEEKLEISKDENKYKGYYGSNTAESSVQIQQKNGYLNWYVR